MNLFPFQDGKNVGQPYFVIVVVRWTFILLFNPVYTLIDVSNRLHVLSYNHSDIGTVPLENPSPRPQRRCRQ